MNRYTNIAVLASIALTLGACKDGTGPDVDGSPGPGETAEIRLELLDGDEQLVPAGSALPTPLTVRAVDDLGRPVPNMAVRWRSNGARPATVTTITDGGGVARLTVTVGGRAGRYSTTASLHEAGGSSVRFTYFAHIEGATQIAGVNQALVQTDTVFTPLPVPFTVVVRNHLNEPVEGVHVRWSDVSGNGTLADSVTLTNAAGEAVNRYRLGSRSGTVGIAAAVAGLPGSPVHFTAVAEPGAPARLEKLSGDDQLGIVGTPLQPYEIQATDSYDNPVAGLRVQWVASSGSIDPSLVMTTGSSTTVLHTLGPQVGTHTATASALDYPHLGSLTFTATAVSAKVSVYTSGYYGYGDDFFGFYPVWAAIERGGAVAWVWECHYCSGNTVHNITFEDDPTEPASSPSQAGGIHIRTFDKPGTYRYRCTHHSTSFSDGMVGIVTVD